MSITIDGYAVEVSIKDMIQIVDINVSFKCTFVIWA